MVERALRITGKTRDAHEVAMNDVADAIKRLFIQWRLVDGGRARSPWSIDDAFAAVAGKTLAGHRVLIFEAAMEVWTNFSHAVGPRERYLDALATLVDAMDAYTATRRDSGVATYLSNISRWGGFLELQCEPRTQRSLGLDARDERLFDHVDVARAEALEMMSAVAERRQHGLTLALYGPRGAGPSAHFAYLLHRAGFSNRQIALIRGDVKPRGGRTGREEWRDALEKAAKRVYLEVRRVREKLAESQGN
jgi:hypothetical protein